MTLESALREKLRSQPLLVMTHIICGYPSLEDNWRMLRIMNEAGVALVEFQFPFSEPSADGPIFCKANQRSLENGTHVADCFALMRRAADELSFMPLMMGYCNTAFKMGYEVFCRRLAEAGGRGFILPDLPPEESLDLERQAQIHDLAPIHLMTPTTRDDRLRLIAAHGAGFHYCVARRGVTGAHTDFGADLDAFLARCRKVTSLPLAVGFGLSTPEDVALLKGKAEIAIIGTAVLKTWESQGEAATEKLIHSLAEAAG
ncbi:MAG: tryptophan synthase subunit alpha [Candidatus Sumerlaeota bacterium]|nr:tryptophan synthase subunit alpha [Candidatus Sumerlaeota bacterium]